MTDTKESSDVPGNQTSNGLCKLCLRDMTASGESSNKGKKPSRLISFVGFCLEYIMFPLLECNIAILSAILFRVTQFIVAYKSKYGLEISPEVQIALKKSANWVHTSHGKKFFGDEIASDVSKILNNQGESSSDEPSFSILRAFYVHDEDYDYVSAEDPDYEPASNGCDTTSTEEESLSLEDGEFVDGEVLSIPASPKS